ncbi:MAG: site-2 protease family protein [Candidatus Paceibacterota bacterium]
MEAVFLIAILIMSVVIHEVAHGYAAYMQGDPTAKYQGRLTLNPLPHLDMIGSIIVPLLFFLTPGNLMLGWAKPVPYNPFNFRNQRWGELIVAIVGPAVNIVIALIFGLFLRFAIPAGIVPTAAVSIISFIVLINLVLALFNMVPIPPLDGSKVLFALLPQRYIRIRHTLEQYGFILVLLFVFLFISQISGVVLFLFEQITGLSGVIGS